MSRRVSPANAYERMPQMDAGQNNHRKLFRASGARRGSTRCSVYDPGKAKKNAISIRGGSGNIHRADVMLSAEVKDRELRLTLWLGLRLQTRLGCGSGLGYIAHELQTTTGS